MSRMMFNNNGYYTDSEKHISFEQMWNWLNYDPDPGATMDDILADSAKINHHIYKCSKCKELYNTLYSIISVGHVFADMSGIIEELNDGQLNETQAKKYLADKVDYYKTCIAPN